MKKSLIALAALAATASFAQSSVTISGAVDVAYATRNVQAADGSSIGKSSGVSEGQNTANRINFAMTEDLGGGMKAGAMVETGLNITNGALFSSRAGAAGIQVPNAAASITPEIPVGAYTTATNRQSYVFANGDFGEVRAGYTRTNLYEQSTFSGYLVGQEQYGSLLHTLGNSVFGGTRGNGLTWITPSMNGFKATLQYGAGGDREVTTTDNTAGINGATNATLKRTGIKIDYNNGPLNLAYGRTNVSAKTTLGTGGTQAGILNIFNAVASTSSPANADYNSNLNQFTGSYEVGALKVTGQILSGKRTTNIAVGTANNTTTPAIAMLSYLPAGAVTDYKAKVLGGIYTIGNVGLFASVGNGSIQNEGSATKLQDIKQQQVGVRYSLSKRTTLYAMTGTSKDTGVLVLANATPLAAPAANGTSTAAKATITGFGMAHSF